MCVDLSSNSKFEKSDINTYSDKKGCREKKQSCPKKPLKLFQAQACLSEIKLFPALMNVDSEIGQFKIVP